MFDFVRSHNRVLFFVLVLLIFPSFVFFGVQGYSRMNEGAAAQVAEVDGRNITQAEWDAAHQRQVETIRRQAPNVDAKLFDTPEFKRETLEQLVRERVFLAAAQGSHLAVSDDRLQRMFLSDPQFEMLRNPDGSINKELLAAQGMSSEQFAQRLRQDLSLRQVTQGLVDSAMPGSSAGRSALDALLQRRELQVQRFESKDYRAKVNPTDADLEAFHKANEALFRTPEQAAIELVVLDLEALTAGLSVKDDDLRKYYEENIARYTSAEERRASHILIKADKNVPAAERAQAKAKAQALLDELRKTPAKFAELAKKNSSDTGSAEKGGDLDFFARGAMVKPFEDAAYAMKPSEISNLVETDFGYHIIRLDAVRGGEKKPFDAVRAEIAAEVGKQLARKEYAAAAEQFTNTVYEQSDSLQPVVDKLKLKKQSATVARAPAPGASGALASAKLLDAVFGNEAVKNKRNTEAVEVGPNQLAAARIVSHQSSRVRPLAEVKEVVRERVVAQQALALARKDGEARLAQLQAKPDALDGLGSVLVVSRAKTEGLPFEAMEAVLRADASKLPASVGVAVGEQAYLVVRIGKVSAPDAEAAEYKQLLPRFAQAWNAAETQAYYTALKSRFKASVGNPAAVAVAASAASR